MHYACSMRALWTAGSDYMPGLIGLNNIKNTDYVNVVVQALSRVAPLVTRGTRPSDLAASLLAKGAPLTPPSPHSPRSAA